ncbi:MAG TPA: hypothetical protein G4O00_14225, partial [Thermoflexia bacterium]|nr:hypothetical protein [Thermoflexia bacterium]
MYQLPVAEVPRPCRAVEDAGAKGNFCPLRPLRLCGTVLGVLLFLLIPLHAAFAKGGTVVRLEPEALTLQPGETGEVIVRIEGVTDLAGAEVHLEYDADLLEVVDADPGTEGVQIGHGGFLAADF